jgi:hypothetical protein
LSEQASATTPLIAISERFRRRPQSRFSVAFAAALLVIAAALPAAAQDSDNDGLLNAADPCSTDPRNLCAGPVASTTDAVPKVIRLNAGHYTSSPPACAGTKVDCNGATWLADFGFNKTSSNSSCTLGGGCVINGITALFGCSDAQTEDLFQCDHYDTLAAPNLIYNFNVASGRYIVNLFFANTFSGTTTVGSRIFDILVEGAVKYGNFDQVAVAGASQTAVVRSVDVTVTDGQLNIELQHGVDTPAIKAIEVLNYGCSTNADCADSTACTTDTCVANACQHTSNCPIGQTCNAQSGVCDAAPISFDASQLVGETLLNPTSLDFGPDGKLYVSQQNGTILGYTIQKNAPNDYVITNTQTINLVKNIPNHNDDGALAPTQTNRLITGLVAAGTPTNPVLYVASGDPRIGGGSNATDTNLDTNSGIISRLTWNGSSWVKLDLVRGLPRSEENHQGNGMYLDATTNTLFIAYGGHTNQGAPSNNFVFLAEYALSAAILSIDLDAIGATTYDIPTLDDQDRTGTDDANDPFGGNNGRNQAKLVPGGPVQIYSPGWRNPYDVIVTEAGRMYSVDNGSNAGWGAVPINEGPAGNCTNDLSEPGATHQDNLHHVTGPGYYAGHPNPTRANMANTFNPANPQSPVTVNNPVECDYRQPSVSGPSSTADGALAIFSSSTNGLTEYTTNDFDGQLQGDLLTVGHNDNLYRIQLNAAGTATTDVSVLFASVGTTPLDVIALGASDPYPGTIWVADHGTDAIFIFEPDETLTCTGADNPALDEDLDQFDNADEIDNGTDPCSSADFPADADGDFTSDLNDSDDDNDGISDTTDKFALDPANGSTTSIPLAFGWENDDPDPAIPGILELGFTGLMTDGTSDYQALFNVTKMTAGGAAGVLTVDEVADGDALNGTNTQQYGFQFGIDAEGTAASVFTIHSRVVGPFLGVTPTDFQSMGVFIGNGDQDNYFKLVISSNGGAGGVESLLETGGVAQAGPVDPIGLPGPDAIDLFLVVDKAAATVQPAYSITNLGVTSNIFDLGGPVSIPTSWLTTATDGLAVGILSTSRGAAPVFAATWDFVEIFIGAPDCTTNAECDDGNSCTTDVCDAGFCANQPVADGTSCSDGLSCTTSDECTAGVCGGEDSCPLFQACNGVSGSCETVTGDPDNDGMSGAGDPCPNDPRNFCFGPVAIDSTSSSAIRIHADDSASFECSGTKVDCTGATWLGSFGHNTGTPSACNLNGGGESCVISGLAGLFGCEDESTSDLFQCERFDPTAAPELLYTFNVPDGDYVVNLFFANTFTGTTTQGSRVFDIEVEDAIPYDNFDQIVEAPGSAVALVRSVLATVDDGNGLQIELLHGVQNPSIKAIEVLAEGAPPPPACTTNADCIDATVCNGSETCNVGVGCQAGTPLTCNDGDACNGVETCDATIGCQAGTPPTCSDGNFCNGTETCVVPTGCQSGTPPSCDDSDPCTTDSCSANQCQNTGSCPSGSVEIDASSIRSACVGTAGDTITISSVPVGSQADRILVVTVGAEEDNADCNLGLASATATYGGVAMSKAATMVSNTSSWRSCNGIFYLLNPPTGTANVVVTFPATTGTAIDNRHAGAFVLFAAAQQAPEAIASAGANTSADPVNTGITPLTVGSTVVDVMTRGNTGTFLTTQSGQIERWEQSCTSSSSATSTKEVTGTGQTLLGWDHSNPNRYAHALAAFAPSGATPTTTTTTSTTTTTLPGPSDAEAFVQITPSGGINASTFNANGYTIRNDSPSGQSITQARIEFAGTLLPDLVFDPAGTAGDTAANCLVPGNGAATTGFITPANLCTTPYSVPYELGFRAIDVFFTDFDPGETFQFAADADPTSIRGTTGQGGDSTGSVSGLELTGANVTVWFDDASQVSGELFRIPSSLSGSSNIANTTVLAAPTIDALGVSEPATVTSASQTIRVSGPAGASVRLMRVQAEMGFNGGSGYDIDPFEGNSAVAVGENAATIGGGGFVDIPVTLTRTSDSSDLNYFAAVVVNSDLSGQTGTVSNVVVLEYVPSGTVQVDSGSLRSACEGTAADTITVPSVPVGSQTNRVLVVSVGAEEDNADCNLGLASATATYGGVAMSKATNAVSNTTGTWRACNGIFYLLNPPTGSADVVVTLPTTTGTPIDNRHVGAFVLFGAAQQAPEATASAGANLSTNPVNTAITPLTVGAAIVDISTRGNTGSFTTTQSGQVEQWDVSCGTTGSSSAGSIKPVTGAGQTTLGWSHTNANRYAHALAAFAPAP